MEGEDPPSEVASKGRPRQLRMRALELKGKPEALSTEADKLYELSCELRQALCKVSEELQTERAKMRDRDATFDDEHMSSLRQAARSDPTNIAAADEYWSALSKWNGRDVRCGGVVIEVYRMAALHSCEGGMAFACAYQALFSISGEAPRGELFEPDLIGALRRCDDGSAER